MEKNTCRKFNNLKKGGKRVSYLGVSAKEAKYFINFACYEEHFFIDEPTPFSTYYIDHLDEVSPEYYDKHFSKDSTCGHWRKARSFAKSSQVVRALFKQDHFRRIKYGE